MILELQFKIKNNPNYQKYIRENSYWYKILNRTPEMFSTFEEEVKHNYRLKFTDKVGDALKTIEMVQNVLTTLK
ncbi:MAG: YlbE-like family protein [Clostridium sp.]|nr:YlbE-like family protein [Clostridium sp.]MCM1444676.1 YlbE-like family protein [Candidatus Amulumruptor caecigallinarius]